ncbi:MAG: ribonuclease HII, partial [Clostridia bacterium]|nr:ribonuclease HII [Clostridia bacterium]
ETDIAPDKSFDLSSIGVLKKLINEIKPDIVLVDAVKLEMEVPCVPIIHGDALSYSIAAASILAKVSRDRIMQEYDKVYPQYLFAKHKGYGTKMHIEAIKEHGSCEIHRKTFITRFI